MRFLATWGKKTRVMTINVRKFEKMQFLLKQLVDFVVKKLKTIPLPSVQ